MYLENKFSTAVLFLDNENKTDNCLNNLALMLLNTIYVFIEF